MAWRVDDASRLLVKCVGFSAATPHFLFRPHACALAASGDVLVLGLARCVLVQCDDVILGAY